MTAALPLAVIAELVRRGITPRSWKDFPQLRRIFGGRRAARRILRAYYVRRPRP